MIKHLFTIAFALVLPTAHLMAQSSNMTRLVVTHIKEEIPVHSLDNPAWERATPTVITRYWSGKLAPANRRFVARLLWSKTALYVRFDANQTEPLVVSDKPDLTKKTIGLWKRDVCEIFIAPDKRDRNKYYEFEIAPTGEWLDLGIHFENGRLEYEPGYVSDLQPAARIEKGKVLMAIKIEWKALRKTPKAGDIWLGNLFRCIGEGATRGNLSWQPTKTPKPNFHVPKAFGEFVFVR